MGFARNGLISTLALVLVMGASGCGGGSGSDCPAFARIVAGDFGRGGDMLWWTMQVAEIPSQLTFNQADVVANVLEYRWAVDIDADRNGATDLRVAITHYRQSGASETTTGDILSVTAEDLWSVFGAGSSTSGSITATISGDTFRMETAVAEDAALAQVTERGQSTWTTYYRHGANLTDQCEDSLK